MIALSLAVQRRRQQLRLSQDEVARRSGLHRTYISELERHSRNFSVRSYFKLVKALELGPAELLRQVEDIAAEVPKETMGVADAGSEQL